VAAHSTKVADVVIATTRLSMANLLKRLPRSIQFHAAESVPALRLLFQPLVIG
jgi:hypothetical protein